MFFYLLLGDVVGEPLLASTHLVHELQVQHNPFSSQYISIRSQPYALQYLSNLVRAVLRFPHRDAHTALAFQSTQCVNPHPSTNQLSLPQISPHDTDHAPSPSASGRASPHEPQTPRPRRARDINAADLSHSQAPTPARIPFHSNPQSLELSAVNPTHARYTRTRPIYIPCFERKLSDRLVSE